MLEYEKFIQKMLALNLPEILPFTTEAIQCNFFLYSAIHWTEVSLTIEALHQGLINLGVSPKDARIKSLKMFQDLLPLRIEEAQKRFLTGSPPGKTKPRINSTKVNSEKQTNCSSTPVNGCSHAFDTLEKLLKFTQEKALELSASSCKENSTDPLPPPSDPAVLSHLVDDVFVVRDPKRLMQKSLPRNSLDSYRTIKEENKKLRHLVNKLEAELAKQSLT